MRSFILMASNHASEAVDVELLAVPARWLAVGVDFAQHCNDGEIDGRILYWSLTFRKCTRNVIRGFFPTMWMTVNRCRCSG